MQAESSLPTNQNEASIDSTLSAYDLENFKIFLLKYSHGDKGLFPYQPAIEPKTLPPSDFEKYNHHYFSNLSMDPTEIAKYKNAYTFSKEMIGDVTWDSLQDPKVQKVLNFGLITQQPETWKDLNNWDDTALVLKMLGIAQKNGYEIQSKTNTAANITEMGLYTAACFVSPLKAAALTLTGGLAASATDKAEPPKGINADTLKLFNTDVISSHAPEIMNNMPLTADGIQHMVGVLLNNQKQLIENGSTSAHQLDEFIKALTNSYPKAITDLIQSAHLNQQELQTLHMLLQQNTEWQKAFEKNLDGTLSSLNQEVKEFKSFVKDYQTKQEQQAALKAKIDTIGTLTDAGVLLASVLGKPKAAKAISVLGGTAITFTSAYHAITTGKSFAAAVGFSAKVTALAPYVAIAGAAFSLISFFTSSDSDGLGEALEGIMEGIRQLSQQIEVVRHEMHQRFDRLENIVGRFYRDVLDEFSKLNQQLALNHKDLKAQLKAIQKTLYKNHSAIMNALADIAKRQLYQHQELIQLFEAYVQDELYTKLSAINNKFNYYAAGLTLEGFQQEFTNLISAIQETKKPSLTTVDLSSPEQIAINLKNASSDKAINSLCQYAFQHYPDELKENSVDTTLVNPKAWIAAMKVLLYSIPLYQKSHSNHVLSLAELEGIKTFSQEGVKVQDFIKTLRKPAFFEKLIEEYKTKLQVFEEKYDKQLTEYERKITKQPKNSILNYDVDYLPEPVPNVQLAKIKHEEYKAKFKARVDSIVEPTPIALFQENKADSITLGVASHLTNTILLDYQSSIHNVVIDQAPHLLSFNMPRLYLYNLETLQAKELPKYPGKINHRVSTCIVEHNNNQSLIVHTHMKKDLNEKSDCLNAELYLFDLATFQWIKLGVYSHQHDIFSKSYLTINSFYKHYGQLLYDADDKQVIVILHLSAWVVLMKYSILTGQATLIDKPLVEAASALSSPLQLLASDEYKIFSDPYKLISYDLKNYTYSKLTQIPLHEPKYYNLTICHGPFIEIKLLSSGQVIIVKYSDYRKYLDVQIQLFDIKTQQWESLDISHLPLDLSKSKLHESAGVRPCVAETKIAGQPYIVLSCFASYYAYNLTTKQWLHCTSPFTFTVMNIIKPFYLNDKLYFLESNRNYCNLLYFGAINVADRLMKYLYSNVEIPIVWPDFKSLLNDSTNDLAILAERLGLGEVTFSSEWEPYDWVKIAFYFTMDKKSFLLGYSRNYNIGNILGPYSYPYLLAETNLLFTPAKGIDIELSNLIEKCMVSHRQDFAKHLQKQLNENGNALKQAMTEVSAYYQLLRHYLAIAFNQPEILQEFEYFSQGFGLLLHESKLQEYLQHYQENQDLVHSLVFIKEKLALTHAYLDYLKQRIPAYINACEDSYHPSIDNMLIDLNQFIQAQEAKSQSINNISLHAAPASITAPKQATLDVEDTLKRYKKMLKVYEETSEDIQDFLKKSKADAEDLQKFKERFDKHKVIIDKNLKKAKNLLTVNSLLKLNSKLQKMSEAIKAINQKALSLHLIQVPFSGDNLNELKQEQALLVHMPEHPSGLNEPSPLASSNLKVNTENSELNFTEKLSATKQLKPALKLGSYPITLFAHSVSDNTGAANAKENSTSSLNHNNLM